MRLRMIPAAVLIGAGALVGSVGVATAAAPAKPKPCTVVERRVPVLESRQAKLNTQLATVADARSRAEAAGRTAVVNRLVARSSNLQLALDKVGTLLDKIHTRCG